MMRCSKNRFVGTLTIIAICSLTFTSSANAQVIPGIGDGLSISVSSSNPTPGQTITIDVSSYSVDISGADISWSIGGKVVKKGVGVNSLDVKAPALGDKMQIDVTATTPDGAIVEGGTVIGSGSVDMVVESDGYVPPLFLGKTPIAYQNSIKVIAIPHLADSSGKELNPTTLIYQWRKNDQLLSGGSGYGKQSIVISGGMIPNTDIVSVTVTNREGGSQAVGKTTLEPERQSLQFYVNDPSYGPLFNIALGDTLNIGSKNETGVLAVPFGFSPGSTLSWLINSVAHPELNGRSSVILRSPGNGGGSSIIHLDVSNAKYILQGISGEFTASFNANPNNNTTDSVSI